MSQYQDIICDWIFVGKTIAHACHLLIPVQLIHIYFFYYNICTYKVQSSIFWARFILPSISKCQINQASPKKPSPPVHQDTEAIIDGCTQVSTRLWWTAGTRQIHLSAALAVWGSLVVWRRVGLSWMGIRVGKCCEKLSSKCYKLNNFLVRCIWNSTINQVA